MNICSGKSPEIFLQQEYYSSDKNKPAISPDASLPCEENTFRACAGRGIWMPGLLPAACVSVCLLQPNSFQHNGPPALLALQSFAFGYYISAQKKTASNNKQKSGTTSSTSANAEGSLVWMKFTCNLVATFLLYFAAGTGLLCSICISCLNMGLQSTISEWLKHNHSLTFSEGEWLTAAQWLTVCISSCVLGLVGSCPASLEYTACQLQSFLQLSSLLSCAAVCVLVHCDLRSPLSVLAVLGALGVAGVTWGSYLLGEVLPLWLATFVTLSYSRLLLLGWWSVCCALAFVFTATGSSGQVGGVTVVRKVYHLVCVAIFGAGVVLDPALLAVAATAATILTCLAEISRIQKLPVISEVLTNCYASFLDEKDRGGSLVLSHVYLLVGLSFPLWLLNTGEETPSTKYSSYCSQTASGTLYKSSSQICQERYSSSDDVAKYCILDNQESSRSESNGCDLETLAYASLDTSSRRLLLLCGVLSVGIGDTFASVFGSLYGKTRWPGTKKTILGSVCGAVAQLVLIVFLCWLQIIVVPGTDSECSSSEFPTFSGSFDSIFGDGEANIFDAFDGKNIDVGAVFYWYWWMGVTATVVTCSLVEAFTDQVDNIVLPVVMFVGVSLTELLTR